MATFKVIPDPRYKRKDNTRRYCLRASVSRNIMYLPVKFSLTDDQHDIVFVKNLLSKECIDIREKCSEIETKAERIYSTMKKYDSNRFKMLFYDDNTTTKSEDPDLPQTMELKVLTKYYLANAKIKHSTQVHFKCSLNIIEQFKPGVYLEDIDENFLKRFETSELDKGKSISTVSSYLRNLRTLVNFLKDTKKILPKDYTYPFGRGGHSIITVRKKKMVMSEEEISKVIELDKFESTKQEYARNIWLVLYYANGINPIDLLRLPWNKVMQKYIPIIRKKTETTRVYEQQEIAVPLTDELKYYLNKVSDPKSQFVLGKVRNGFTDTSLFNRKNKFRHEINTELKKIGNSLGLSVPLRMCTARDCYASTLKRNNVSRETISDSLGHSDIRTTAHYLDSLSIDESFNVNNKLVKRKIKVDDKNPSDNDQMVGAI